MKIPKLKGGSYFCLRAAGLLIAGATVIYFVCDNSVSNNEHTFMGPISKDSPLERLIKWKCKCGMKIDRKKFFFQTFCGKRNERMKQITKTNKVLRKKIVKLSSWAQKYGTINVYLMESVILLLSTRLWYQRSHKKFENFKNL